jgi:N-acetylmuramoyl-L-alanine amidase
MAAPLRTEAAVSNISFYFGNSRLNSEIKVIAKDGVKYINLSFVIKYLHVGTDWDSDSGELYCKLGQSNIKLKENSKEYLVDGTTLQLSVAPFESEGQLWLPIDFLLKLGLTVIKEDAQSLRMDWAENYLLAMESLKYQGRPAFLLVGTEKFNIKSFVLTEPDRLVLDLKGFKAHPTFDATYHDAFVKNVRFFQYQSDALRLVFDLNQLAGYQIIPHPENPNQVYIVFNYFVQEINFLQKDNERKVYIKTSLPAKYSVKTVTGPRRLIIDFDGATLGRSGDPIPGDNYWIKSVRMSQFNSQTVRVVLDMIGTQPAFIVPSRQDPTLLEIRTAQSLNAIDWAVTDQGGALTISGDGELMETIHKMKNPDKLQIDFDYSQLAPGLKTPDARNEQVLGLRLQQLGGFKSRVEVDLNNYVGYSVRYSNDRHKLTIYFNKSPLIGKTIVLDAGHGGPDMGATGRQGTREKNINLDVTFRLKDLLEEAGARVVLTRNDDIFISLYERSFVANTLNAEMFISVHTNFHPKSEVKGIEVYYYPGKDEGSSLLAKTVDTKMVESTGLNNLGVKTNDFVVIRETHMPSILVELGFLSNYEEENTIATASFREKAATGIFQGIIGYYNTQPKG